MVCRECYELFASGRKEWIGSYEERAGSLLDQGSEGVIEVAFDTGPQGMEL